MERQPAFPGPEGEDQDEQGGEADEAVPVEAGKREVAARCDAGEKVAGQHHEQRDAGVAFLEPGDEEEGGQVLEGHRDVHEMPEIDEKRRKCANVIEAAEVGPRAGAHSVPHRVGEAGIMTGPRFGEVSGQA